MFSSIIKRVTRIRNISTRKFSQMTPKVSAFDHWMRNGFRNMNTELENLYFELPDREDIGTTGIQLKRLLVEEGRSHVVKILEEGNTDGGFDQAFNLLGSVGMYMAACERHEISLNYRDTTSPLKEASALALHLGASLGMTPRFSTAHVTTSNLAVDGKPKGFTCLKDEEIFMDYNTLGILAYQRTAEALLRIESLGVSSRHTGEMLQLAKTSLQDVARYNQELFDQLDTDRFFYSVRPYFKPHHVGIKVYRGANAGDFAGINIIDMLLGLCDPRTPWYSHILVDKLLYMMPAEQTLLRETMRKKPIINDFLDCARKHADTEWYQRNLRLYLEVCEAHGFVAKQHMKMLVEKFIVQPAEALPDSDVKRNITASGPPLHVMLSSLEKLSDLRQAKDRPDIPSRFQDIEYLRSTLHSSH